jgi:hypothetical protein
MNSTIFVILELALPAAAKTAVIPTCLTSPNLSSLGEVGIEGFAHIYLHGSIEPILR